MNIDWLTHFEVTWPSVLLGMITGLTYGIIAVGLVLVYRSSRIINFAQGAIGALGAALAGVAVVEAGRVTRVGLGMASVAPVTALLQRVRDLALSKPLADLEASDLEAAVDADVSPLDDIRSTRAYRVHCARTVTRAFFRSLGAAV